MRRAAERPPGNPPDAGCVATLALFAVFIGTVNSPSAARARSAEHVELRVHGRVWEDLNGNGAVEPREAGLAGVWIGALGANRATIASARTKPDGSYELRIPGDRPGGPGEWTIECVPPAGRYPLTPLRRTWSEITASDGRLDFGMNDFATFPLTAGSVSCLASGDLAEKDWCGDRETEARRDADLVLGAESGADEVSVWSNHYDHSPLFTRGRSYGRRLPRPVLALAVGALGRGTPDASRGADLVTGTAPGPDGNLFVWHTQRTPANEGYLPARYSDAYRTRDGGDVVAVVTGDVTGDATPDLLVGTRFAPGRGTIELWRSNGGSRPTFRRAAIDGLPDSLGEVTAMRLVDAGTLDGPVLVVGTRTAAGSGQVLFLSAGRASEAPFMVRAHRDLDGTPVTALAAADYDLDGRFDVIVATQTGHHSGRLALWKNSSANGGDSLAFVEDQSVAIGAIPLALACADLGGSRHPDLLVGLRANDTGYRGGLALYYLDGGTLPPAPTDPSGGAVTDMVPSIALDHFNTGVPPVRRGLDPADIAIAVRSGPLTGGLIVYIR